ncbi:MAG: ABC transporter ATP-binding protein, partial [Mucilaginibacter polytrichastri]|nr:ABC transporter ATP-binding protein [Mucilaginibacter polytrichastri]
MAQVTGKAVDVRLLRRVMHYVRPYRGLFAWATFLTILLAFVAPLPPLLIQYTVDHFIFTSDFPGLVRMTMLMIGITAGQSIFQYYQTYSTNQLGQSVILDLRKDVFNHIISLRVKYFDKSPIGMLITRTVSDLETIADIFSEGIIAILGSILQVITLLAVMSFSDWRLTLITLIPMPFLLLATYIFKEAIKSAFQDVRTQVTHLNTFLQEHITGMPVIQYFAREDQESGKFDAVNKKHRDAHIRSNWYYSIFFPVVELISAISLGLLVWYGSTRILNHQVSAGVVTAFILYINMLFRPIRELADKFNTLQMG